jgi:hypothetical protein
MMVAVLLQQRLALVLAASIAGIAAYLLTKTRLGLLASAALFS